MLLVWALLPLVVKVFTRRTLFEIQAPLTVAPSRVQDLQTFWANRLRSKDELLLAGRETAGLIAEYAYGVQQNEQLKAEILRLENLLRLPGWWQRLVIRKGENHGIIVGAPVVYVGGVVGRVSEVYRNTSIVDLITSPSVRLATSVEGDNRPIS